MANLADVFITYKTLDRPVRQDTVLQDTDTELRKLLDEWSATPDTQDTSGTKQEGDYVSMLSEEEEKDADYTPDNAMYAWAGDIYTPVPLRQKRYSRGNLAKEIEDLFGQEGINIKVTSDRRPAGAAGNIGKASNHVYGNAVDIIPDTSKGETFGSLRKAMTTNPNIRKFFEDNMLGVLDETSKDMQRRTGATGAHYHIGPDSSAVKLWAQWIAGIPIPSQTDGRAEWTRMMYRAYLDGLKREYGGQRNAEGKEYTDEDFDRIATYMTQQSAIESGYGQHGHGYNYGGHMKGGRPVRYDSLDDYVNAHLRTLRKWPNFINAPTLRSYVDSLYKGDYLYNASDTSNKYFNRINATKDRVYRYLGKTLEYGGTFTGLRKIYEKGFGKHRGA